MCTKKTYNTLKGRYDIGNYPVTKLLSTTWHDVMLVKVPITLINCF